MLPILKRSHKRNPLVADVQAALNRQALVHKNAKRKPLEVDGIFGPLTEGRVQEFQKSAALDPDGRVGPLTRTALYDDGYNIINGAQQIAIGWVLVTRGAVAGLLADAQRVQSGGAAGLGDRINRAALKTHFHIDLDRLRPADAAQAVALLNHVSETYDKILNTLNTASVEKEVVFCRAGFHEIAADFGSVVRGSRAFGYVIPRRDFVRFTPNYTEDDGLLINKGPVKVKRVNTLIHECAHFVDPDIHDFGFESPAPGRVGTRGSKSYEDLNPADAVNNGATYGTFAQNIILRADLRAPAPAGLFEICDPADG
jgi:hypothetical protein